MNDQELDAKVAQLKLYWGNARANMHEEQELFDLHYDNIRVPPDIEVHIPSTAPRVIETAANAIPTDKVIPHVPPRGVSAEATKQANLLERMHEGFIQYLQSGTEIPTPRQLTIDALLRGGHCWKVVPTVEGMSRDGQTRQLWELFTVRTVDPLNVMIPPGRQYPLAFLVEEQEDTYNNIMLDERLLGWPNPKHRMGNETVLREEIWTADEYRIRLDGITAHVTPHDLGAVPYFFGYNGLGRIDATSDPATAMRGLLRHVKSELRGEVRGRTAIDAIWQFTAFPTLITPDNPAKTRQQMDGGPGRIVQGKKDEMGWLENPAPPPTLARFLDDVSGSIQQSTFAPSFAGQQQSNMDSGYQMALSIGRGRMFLGPVAYSVKLSIQHGLSFMAEMADKYDMRFSVWGRGKRTLDSREPEMVPAERMVHGARDIAGHYIVEVAIEATDPVENDRRALTGAKLQAQRLITRRRTMEQYIGVEDAGEEEDEIMAEMMKERAIASGMLDQYIAEALGVQLQDEKMQQQEQDMVSQLKKRATGPVRDQATQRLQRMQTFGTGELDSREAMGLPALQGRR